MPPPVMSRRSPGLHTTCVAAVAAALLGCCPEGENLQSGVPILFSPAPGAVVDNGCLGGTNLVEWMFDWSAPAGADLYQLVVWRMGMNTAIDRSDIGPSDFTYRHTGWIDDAHLDGWLWKVRARTNGVWGEWTAESPFVVEPLGTDCR